MLYNDITKEDLGEIVGIYIECAGSTSFIPEEDLEHAFRSLNVFFGDGWRINSKWCHASRLRLVEGEDGQVSAIFDYNMRPKDYGYGEARKASGVFSRRACEYFTERDSTNP